MELVRNDLAVFTAKSGRTVEFIPWPSDVERAPSYWSIWAYDGSLRDMMQFFRRHVPWHPYREPLRPESCSGVVQCRIRATY